MRAWLMLLLAVPLAACASGSTTSCRCGADLCPEARCAPPDAGGGDASVAVDGGDPLVDGGPPDAPPPDVPGCEDADGDGYPSAGCGGTDCDDGDDSANPGAGERCDGADDDCDGRTDEGSFEAFFVAAGSSTWRRYDLECASPAAPTSAVQTVFDVESLGRAYFLTATSYHVLDLLERRWIGNGARATIMPEAVGATLSVSYTTPAGHAGSSTTIETLYVASATQIFVYQIDLTSPASPAFTFPAMVGTNTNPLTWTAPAGLLTAYQDVTGTWAPDPRPTCPDATYSAGPYAAYFTADRVTIDDNGSCFVQIADLPIASFGPFTASGAPARSAWSHAAYNAGLWLFGAPRLP